MRIIAVIQQFSYAATWKYRSSYFCFGSFIYLFNSYHFNYLLLLRKIRCSMTYFFIIFSIIIIILCDEYLKNVAANDGKYKYLLWVFSIFPVMCIRNVFCLSNRLETVLEYSTMNFRTRRRIAWLRFSVEEDEQISTNPEVKQQTDCRLLIIQMKTRSFWRWRLRKLISVRTIFRF